RTRNRKRRGKRLRVRLRFRVRFPGKIHRGKSLRTIDRLSGPRMTVHLSIEVASMSAVDDDTLWLQEYVETGSQDAFTKMVNRHVDLVYAAAVRQLHDR